MSLRRGSWHQSWVIPAAATCTVVGLYPAWYQHDVREDGPILATRAQVEAWSASRVRQAQCLPASVSLKIVAQNTAEFSREGSGPYFGTLRCNQRRAYWRLFGVILLPWLVLSFFARLLF